MAQNHLISVNQPAGERRHVAALQNKLAHKAAHDVEDSIVGLRDFRGAFYSSSQVERRSNLVDPVGMDRLCQQTIGLLVKARRSGGHGEGIGDRKKDPVRHAGRCACGFIGVAYW